MRVISHVEGKGNGMHLMSLSSSCKGKICEMSLEARWGGAMIQTSLGDLDRKGLVGKRQPQKTVHSTFWISWFLKA